MTIKTICCVLAMAAVAALTSCTKKSEDIKIGVYGPFSGGSAPMGLSMRNGVQLAIDEINVSGGVLGKKLVMVDRDDEAKNERGEEVMRELLDKEDVVAILGPVNTGVANATTGYTNKKKVPQIINVSAGAKVNEHFKEYSENYIFRVAANDTLQAKMVVAESAKRGYKSPALLCDDTSFGKNGCHRMEEALKASGLKPVYIGTFKINDTDMSQQVQEAKSAKADVLLLWGIGPELAAISNSMDRLGWKVDRIGSWTLAMSNYISSAGKGGNGTTMPQTFIEASASTPRQVKFVADYRKKYNENPMQSAVAAAQGYDSVYLLKMAIQQAGSTKGPKIKAALEDLAESYEGVTGSYAKPFSATEHEAVKEANVRMGMIKDGQVVDAESAVKNKRLN